MQFFSQACTFPLHWLWQRLPAHSKQEFKASQISVCVWPSFSYKLSHAFLTLEMLNTVQVSAQSMLFFVSNALLEEALLKKKSVHSSIQSVVLDVKLLVNFIHGMTQMLWGKSCYLFITKQGRCLFEADILEQPKIATLDVTEELIWSSDINLMQPVFYSVGVSCACILFWQRNKKKKM